MTDTHTMASAGGETKSRAMLTWILGALSIFAPFSTDMYLSGFNLMASDFDTSMSQVQLSLSTFFVGMAIGQLLYGPLIDRYGRRVPLLGGVALFIVTSLAILYVPNIEGLIGLRFFQAIGGCSGMVISRAIIQDLFDEQEAAKALSLMMVVQTVGPITAPVIGAYLLVFGGWKAVFTFLVAFGVICWLITAKWVPESLPVERRQKQNIGEMMTVFKRFLCDWRFMSPTLAGSFSNSVMFCFITGSPFVLMQLFGMGRETYGWMFSGTAAGMVITSQANRMLLKRFTPKLLFTASIIISLVASVALVLVRNTDQLWLFMIPLFVCVSMVPMVCANSIAIAMSVSGRDAGSASSLVGVCQFAFAGAISAIVGALHNGTSLPMCGMILVCTVLAFVVNYLGHKAPAK
ncbi:multidrug effflux MFS transporter [Vibrio nitrifigilis]|uniref:Bcr/CflA family efflux transporter n=1 Tax=Vibrio nitrifigilis TaxID=2789781 RepID=A0ABS0GB11_9VIBR|nr:multidrug effflux MFS transporter [Vibrio nitrifigilis]MBF8999577.1 multidrug effflux MFS transporter [Vibrio nitrifigilis]